MQIVAAIKITHTRLKNSVAGNQTPKQKQKVEANFKTKQKMKYRHLANHKNPKK
jgi:hypothetical protein